MSRQPVMARLNLAGTDEFARHATLVTQHCPYLGPSVEAGATYVQTVELGGSSLEECEAENFYLLVEATERFRAARRAAATPAEAALLCFNLVVNPPREFQNVGRDLFDWPHFLAKLLYTDQAILFGKFWKGETEVSTTNEPLPTPPVNFWSIRSKVKHRDVRFFELTPSLVAAHLDGEDDGRNVHADFGFHAWEPDIMAMRTRRYYEELKEWGRRRLDS